MDIGNRRKKQSSPRTSSSRIHRHAAAGLEEVTLWIVAFSTAHVGLSAIREGIISGIGGIAGNLGLVGTKFEFPSFWPGDASGNRLWNDEGQAGRQIFRILYSLVAGFTLQGAFAAYLAAAPGSEGLIGPLAPNTRTVLLAIASLAQGISIASLFNPSPLSLVPGFRSSPDGGQERDDSLKLRPYGLTRITRHPLILPVVPWSIANGLLAGGRPADLALFGGIAIYTLIGCWAQDLRARESEAVGTVFSRGDLTEFYQTTSFVPFAALLDGRQQWKECIQEIQWISLTIGLALGIVLELAIVNAMV